MKINALLFFSILVTLTSCKGQNADKVNNSSPVTTGDTVKQLSDAIMIIYHDKMNNYWFGSKGQGVFRYDGKNMLQFTTGHGLISNDIWGIQEDKAGNIYFDTQEGVSKFNGQTFSTLPLNAAAVSEWKLEPDDLWFKGNWNTNGAYRFDGKELHQLKFPENKRADSLRANSPNMTWSPYGLYSLYKDRKGNIWFGTSNVGIYRYGGKSLSHMYEDHLTNTPNGGSFGIRSILEDSTGKFWFCNTRYRYIVEPGNTQDNLIPYKREKAIDNLRSVNGDDLIYFMSVTEDNKQNLWMVTYSEGVWRYDGKNTTHYPVKDGDKDVKLYSIYKDNNGDLWLGTHEAGAYKFNGKEFKKFKL